MIVGVLLAAVVGLLLAVSLLVRSPTPTLPAEGIVSAVTPTEVTAGLVPD